MYGKNAGFHAEIVIRNPGSAVPKFSGYFDSRCITAGHSVTRVSAAENGDGPSEHALHAQLRIRGALEVRPGCGRERRPRVRGDLRDRDDDRDRHEDRRRNRQRRRGLRGVHRYRIELRRVRHAAGRARRRQSAGGGGTGAATRFDRTRGSRRLVRAAALDERQQDPVAEAVALQLHDQRRRQREQRLVALDDRHDDRSETPLLESATTSSIVTADAVAGTQPRRTSISRNRRTLKSVQPPRQPRHADLLAFLRVRLHSAQDTFTGDGHSPA